MIKAQKKQISAISPLHPPNYIRQTPLTNLHPFPAIQMQSECRFIDFLDLIQVHNARPVATHKGFRQNSIQFL
jgi:hypothetical protein